ncbi:DNA replication factor Cdt1 [Biomphalaria pfeifferi]|uniref:DNA replication factor Cdt1 n=1 Tax=Biomphalaria pfeifferi TaxID=112525 RepID=A0AAD8B1P3_BIOPF|nr:DNA replication factor Cdt1 [Biomphalaria pfeifferi]
MAQTCIDSFFAKKKKNVPCHPSKRRKIELMGTDNDKCSKLTADLDTKHGKSRSITIKPAAVPDVTEVTDQTDVIVNNDNTRSRSNVLTITSKSSTITDKITSVWDDQVDNAYITPRKRPLALPDVELNNGHDNIMTRRKKTLVKTKRLTSDNHPAKTIQVDAFFSAKKKLELIEKEVQVDTEQKDESDQEVAETLSSEKKELVDLISVIPTPMDKVSPLPPSPVEDLQEKSQLETTSDHLKGDNPPATTTPKDLPKRNNYPLKLSKMKSEAIKNKLKQSGQMSQLKGKLEELKCLIDKNKTVVSQAVSHDVEVEAQDMKPKRTSTLPAYQRFEYLTEPGTPTLTLPYTYKTLEGVHQSVEQVVSMLHNRSEICTFSKLQTAVQNITRKNFEMKALGQIKTIVPDTYIYRQEKNIPQYGMQLSSNYQLTVEPNLQVEDSTGPLTAEGKPMFSASLLLKRQNVFKKRLLAYLKEHHKKFLASLKIPLNVPDDKITRWHPLFQLDKVPEVIPAELPKPPEVKVYHSAKDVLEKQRGKLNPLVEKALSKVVAHNENEGTTKSQTNNVECSTSTSSNQTVATMKGIPPALLAKIRAKEAQRMEEALTRKPEEDTKIKIMNKLPEIIRTLRALFVTEKKMALPLDQVYKKIEENYKYGMSLKDVENHMNMLKELAPELVSIVEIKRGKYMKLDKNVDVQAVISKILNLSKAQC